MELDKMHEDYKQQMRWSRKYLPLRDNQQPWLVSPQAVPAAETHLQRKTYKHSLQVLGLINYSETNK